MRVPHLFMSCTLAFAMALPAAPGAQTRPMPPSTADWYIVLFDQGSYRGNPTNVDRAVGDTRKRTVRSVTIGRGRWELCEGRNFSGRCVTVDSNTPDLRAIGLQRVGSARPSPAGQAPAPVPDGAYIVLYDQTNYRGSPQRYEGQVTNTGWNAKVRSVTIGRGVWEICERANFSGRCVVLERNVADLGTVGFKSRVGSARPAMQPR